MLTSTFETEAAAPRVNFYGEDLDNPTTPAVAFVDSPTIKGVGSSASTQKFATSTKLENEAFVLGTTSRTEVRLTFATFLTALLAIAHIFFPNPSQARSSKLRLFLLGKL